MDTFQAPSGPLPAEAGTPEEIYRFVIEAAVHAPSVQNTQPWWFSYGEVGIGVHADTDLRLPVADPRGREMMISCGAALFTIRAALRHLGLVPEVRVLPDPDLRNLVARVTWSEHVPPVEFEQRLYAEIPRRRTHRGGFEPGPLLPTALAALGQEAAKEKTRMHVMSDDESAGLAAVVAAADYALRRDKAHVHEQAH